MQVVLTVSDRLDEEYDDQRDMSSICIKHGICSRMDRFYSTVLLWKKSDTDEKLMTAQDSLCIAAVRGRILVSAANFNIVCKINVFILLIIFGANWIDIYYCMGLFCICFITYRDEIPDL